MEINDICLFLNEVNLIIKSHIEIVIKEIYK